MTTRIGFIGLGLIGRPLVESMLRAGLQPGLIDRIIAECPNGSSIVCAGGWYTGDTVSVTAATPKGAVVRFGGAPEPDDWYGTLDAVCAGRLDPIPSIGMTIGLDGVPDAIAMARRAEGPPRIVVHPGG